MGKIKEEILKTIDIIIDEKIKKLNFDRTYIGTISKILENGYVIKYNGAEITIKENIKKFKKGETVRFCVPCGNKRNAFII